MLLLKTLLLRRDLRGFDLLHVNNRAGMSMIFSETIRVKVALLTMEDRVVGMVFPAMI